MRINSGYAKIIVWIKEILKMRYAINPKRIVLMRANLYSLNSLERIMVMSLSDISIKRMMKIISERPVLSIL